MKVLGNPHTEVDEAAALNHTTAKPMSRTKLRGQKAPRSDSSINKTELIYCLITLWIFCRETPISGKNLDKLIPSV